MRKIRYVVHDHLKLRSDVKGNAKARAARAAKKQQEGRGAPPMLPPEVRAAIGKVFRVMANQGVALDAASWSAVATAVVRDMGYEDLLFNSQDPSSADKFKISTQWV